MDQLPASPNGPRRIAAAAYAVAALLFLVPISEMGAQLQWHFAPSAIQWRVGVVGLLSGVVSPVFAIFLAAATAYFADHRRTLRAFSALSLLGALLLIGLIITFALDALQLRGNVRPEAARTFNVAALKAVVNLFLMSVALGVVGFTGWRAARWAGKEGRASRKTASAADGALIARTTR
jgi:chromate transport protein ChrA